LVFRADTTGTVDLVLVIDHIGGQRGEQAQALVFIGEADFPVHAGLRREVRVADDHTAHGGGAEVRGAGTQVGCLVARGDAAFDGEVVVQVKIGRASCRERV